MKSFSSLSLMMLTAALFSVSCSKKEPVQPVKANAVPQPTATATTAPTYAIVDIDSLSKNYELCKEKVKELESKQATFSNQINNKMAAFQNHAAKFQEDYQSNKFTSQQEFEGAQVKLQNEQDALQKLQNKIETEMAEAMQKYQTILQDSINNFIKDYNKDGKYKAIFSKVGNNVLFADPSIDITQDVVDGLNKRYNKKK